jgi:tRNA nucleotidyltransferase/poly(A) polymerase
MATRRLTPDAQLFAWARGAATGLEAVAPERVSSELGKLLAETRVAPALRWAARAGILGAALGVQLPPASARALARAAAALDGPRVGSLPGPSRRRIRLAWLAVRLGFEPRAARKWLAGRRWPGREAEEVAGLVSLAARAAEAPTGDDAWRWILDAGALVEDAAALAAVLGRGRRSAAAAERLLRLARGPRLSLRVSGRDVMEWTGLPPGPRIGELLDRLALASAAGRVRTRRDAKRWLLVETDAASS